jgi:cation:H+ antiporter
MIGFRKKFRSNEIGNALVLLFFSLVPLLLVIDGQLTSLDSMILLALFVMFVGYILMNKTKMNNIEVITKKEAGKDFIIFLASMGIVMISAGVVVHSATVIAEDLGLFKSFIGATIIALGTSLPELAVDTTAVRKGKAGMALGDIVGSNVVNLTLVLGVNALINPFAPNLKMIGPVMLFILAAVALLAFFIWKNKTITKRDGMVLLGLYILYLLAASGVQIFQFA